MKSRLKAPIARGARTNVALLGLLAVAFLTGWLAFAFATAPARWSLVLHASSGFAILALLPWKSMVARRGTRRTGAASWRSFVLAALVLVSLVAGLLHSTGIATQIGPFSAMTYHVGGAIAAVPFAIWHLFTRRVRLRRTDLSRRALLRGGAVVATAIAGYAGSELIVRATGLPGAARRFTGSYEARDLPVSNWLFDPVPELDASAWTLSTPARTWSYSDLMRFNDRVTATLDCTGGFYSTQQWSGVRLDRLLAGTSGASIRVVSHTGYDRRFPIEDAPRLLLATSIGGRPLSSGNGYPARLVSPDRRGFWWVKWVVAIEVDDLPHWWQSPFPLQ